MTATQWAKVMETNTGAQLQWGPNSVGRYLLDPKRIAFMMSRYKFAAKMLRGCTSIIDVGCGDGMGTVTFLEDTGADIVRGIDMDAALIEHANSKLWPAVNDARDDAARLGFSQRDVLLSGGASSGATRFGGLSCLDVIEHIEPTLSIGFIGRLAALLAADGIAVIGTPNAYAAEYGSPQSKLGHINNYTPDRLREELGKHFRHVFLFSMNDEIVHTGFDKLAHYLIALCVK